MKNYLMLLLVVLVLSCKSNNKTTEELAAVDQTTIAKHIEHLASDEFLGRKPFTEGEVKTVNYLKDEFEKLGALPGNEDSFSKRFLW
ncbi:hypothetical protein ACU8V7_22050 [Zobellia nedashkovskayae]